jgi:signal peptidase
MGITYTTDEQIDSMKAELQRARQKADAMQAHRVLYSLKASLRILSHTLFYTTVAALLLVLVTVLVAKGRGKIPSVMGYQLFVVESGSMSPTLEVGAVFVSRSPKNAAQLSSGQIITFASADGTVITHRIIDVQKDDAGNLCYRTKGDNPLNSPDESPVYPEAVLGVFVFKIPLT